MPRKTRKQRDSRSHAARAGVSIRSNTNLSANQRRALKKLSGNLKMGYYNSKMHPQMQGRQSKPNFRFTYRGKVNNSF